MLKYLFVDFDGILTDTETEVFHRMRSWIAQHTGHSLTLEEYALAAGSWHAHLVDYMKNLYGDDFDSDAFYRFGRTLEGEVLGALPLMPGVRRLLDDAKNLGIRCGIVSSNLARTIQPRLDFLHIRSDFSFVLTAEDVETLKPAPDLYLKALDVSQVSPKEALVIEDSKNGIIAATAAGLKTLAVPCTVTRSYPFTQAWLKVDSLEAISLAEVAERFAKESA